VTTGFIHCSRCSNDVPTHEYSQHLLQHVRQKPPEKMGARVELDRHKFGDARCLATANVDARKHPEMRGQRRKARAALLRAQREEEAKTEAKKQVESKKRQEVDKRERAKREAQDLARAVAAGRSQGNPYSALTINKGKKWKGRVKVVSGGSPGSKR